MIKMPWIDQDKCVGCGICVEECSVNALTMEGGKAEINIDDCIRCGKCHEICPQDAIRHDSEKIPQEIEENIKWVETLMRHYKTKEEREGFLGRMKNHFNKEKIVAEGTLKEIENFGG